LLRGCLWMGSIIPELRLQVIPIRWQPGLMHTMSQLRTVPTAFGKLLGSGAFGM